MFYVNILDAWSNVNVVGPFDSKEKAHAYPVPAQFDKSIVTSAELEANFREFGAVEITEPE
jgi:hypothetical protein